MKEIIEKAIEGGWSATIVKAFPLFETRPAGIWFYSDDAELKGAGCYEYWDKVFMSPLLWQALGKVSGWDCNCGRDICCVPTWEDLALKFLKISLNEDRDAAIRWLSTLIK